MVNRQILEATKQSEAKVDAKLEQNKEEAHRSPGGGHIKLLNPKETTIQKLEESANKEDIVR